MPAYRYRPSKGSCRLCGDGFDCVQSPTESPLEECPKCGLEVSRIIPDQIHTPRLLAPLAPSKAKAAGFTILKRTSDGNWEKQ
jgi:putative FmdB family regulatory protein